MRLDEEIKTPAQLRQVTFERLVALEKQAGAVLERGLTVTAEEIAGKGQTARIALDERQQKLALEILKLVKTWPQGTTGAKAAGAGGARGGGAVATGRRQDAETEPGDDSAVLGLVRRLGGP